MIRLTEEFNLKRAQSILRSDALPRNERMGLASYVGAAHKVAGDIMAVRVEYAMKDPMGRFVSKVNAPRATGFVAHYSMGMVSEVQAWLAHELYYDIHIRDAQPAIRAKLFASVEILHYPEGCTFATLCQDLERRCVVAMYDAATKEGYAIGALKHDGMLVRRRRRSPLGRAVLARWEQAIETATGFAMTLAEKPMELDPDFIGPEVEADDGHDAAIDALIERFNTGWDTQRSM